MQKKNARTARRVNFDRGFEAAAIAVDGTWVVKGRLNDISATGAKFRASSPISERLRTEEFFLVMNPATKVNRRCSFVWEKDGCVGIKFVSNNGL